MKKLSIDDVARKAGVSIATVSRVINSPELVKEKTRKRVEEVIAQHNLPWIVKQLGCRVEYWFRPAPPRNGGEASAAVDTELDRYMHLCALNRGILMTPFHNMALIAPDTSEADIDLHTQVFAESVQQLLA